MSIEVTNELPHDAWEIKTDTECGCAARQFVNLADGPSRGFGSALRSAMGAVIRQKSAEAIVGAEADGFGTSVGNEP
jgi:hypothetical protein